MNVLSFTDSRHCRACGNPGARRSLPTPSAPRRRVGTRPVRRAPHLSVVGVCWRERSGGDRQRNRVFSPFLNRQPCSDMAAAVPGRGPRSLAQAAFTEALTTCCCVSRVCFLLEDTLFSQGTGLHVRHEEGGKSTLLDQGWVLSCVVGIPSLLPMTLLGVCCVL
ncbi:uncharacterized protein WM277_003964 isoform 2-T2 [Molossus nigricans]